MLTQISPEFTLVRSSDRIARPTWAPTLWTPGIDAQLVARASDDPGHLGMRDPRRPVPVDEQVALTEARERGIVAGGDEGKTQDDRHGDHCDAAGHQRGPGAPQEARDRRPIGSAQATQDRRFAPLARRGREDEHRQCRRHRDGHQDRGQDGDPVRGDERRQERADGARHEQQWHERDEDDQRPVDGRPAALEDRLGDDGRSGLLRVIRALDHAGARARRPRARRCRR